MNEIEQQWMTNKQIEVDELSKLADVHGFPKSGYEPPLSGMAVDNKMSLPDHKPVLDLLRQLEERVR